MGFRDLNSHRVTAIPSRLDHRGSANMTATWKDN